MGANRERAIAALREMWGMPQTEGVGVLQPHEHHVAVIEKALDEAEQRGRETPNEHTEIEERNETERP